MAAFKLIVVRIRLCINFFIPFHIYIFSAFLYIRKDVIDASLYRTYVIGRPSTKLQHKLVIARPEG